MHTRGISLGNSLEALSMNKKTVSAQPSLAILKIALGVGASDLRTALRLLKMLKQKGLGVEEVRTALKFYAVNQRFFRRGGRFRKKSRRGTTTAKAIAAKK